MRRICTTSALFIPLILSACDGGYTASSSQSAAGTARGVTNSSGTDGSTTNTHTVGGSVEGASGDGLILEINGTTDVTVGASGTFVFPQGLPSGASYSVAIKSQPSVHHEICTISNGSGQVDSSDVSTVAVTCTLLDGFMYVFNPVSQIATYGVTAGTGAPLPLGAGISLPTSRPLDLVATPNGKFLYALSVNGATDQISTFAIDSDHGDLTSVGAPLQVGAEPGVLAITPDGSILLVTSYGDGSAAYGDSTIQSYFVDPATGALTYASTVTIPKHIRFKIVVTPDSRYVYVMNADINTGKVIALTPYSIDSTTGVLTAGVGFTPSDDAGYMAVDPLGSYLYLTIGSSDPWTASATVQPYSIDSTNGALTAIGTGTHVATNGMTLTADPQGRYVYALNNHNSNPSDDSIVALAIDRSSGTLAPVAGPTGTVLTGSVPWAIACDPKGDYVYTANASPAGGTSNLWNDVSGFAIDQSSGGLTAAGLGIQFNYATQSLGSNAIAIVE